MTPDIGTDDTGPTTAIPPFRPARLPGLHIPAEALTRQGVRQYLRPVDFFNLFLTVCSTICLQVHKYEC